MKKRIYRILAVLTALCLLPAVSGTGAAKAENEQWWKNTIAYEIYVRSFRDTNGDGIGDLKGITQELDYLKELGAGALWLTPCYASPQEDNGYDIANFYEIDPIYGTMEDMDELISEAGKRGIRIVMDLVFNHTSDANPWFVESRAGRNNEKSDWYIWRDPAEDGGAPTNWRSIFGGSAWEYDRIRGQYYLHTFLKQQPDLNWENPEVRKALIDVANFWVNKGVGGFRLDAITYIKKPAVFENGRPDADDRLSGIHALTADTPGILDFLREFQEGVTPGTDIFMVGEANGVAPEELPEWVGGDGVMDMIFEISHVLIDLPDEMNWCKTREWTIPELKKMFSASQEMTRSTKGWVPVFLENHDQPRSINHFLPEGADRVAGGKALGTLLLTMRGTPFIMQGEELGLVNVAWESIDEYKDVSTFNHYWFALGEGYTQEEAMAAVNRFSRDNARTPLQWTDGENAGFTTGTPWIPVNEDYKTFNAASEKADPDSVLNWYITLAKLRSEHEELLDGDYRELFPEHEQIFAYERKNETAKAVILINLTTEPAAYDPACLEGAELLLSSAKETEKGTLAPLEAVIYEAPAGKQ